MKISLGLIIAGVVLLTLAVVLWNVGEGGGALAVMVASVLFGGLSTVAGLITMALRSGRFRTLRVWLAAALVPLALVAVVGFFTVLGMFTGEYWCEDRSPWWGPPEDPNSTCSGHSWEGDHPGEFPWTMPR